MTDAAATELSDAGRGNLPGMSQRQLTCAALGRGYPRPGSLTICEGAGDGNGNGRGNSCCSGGTLTD